MEIKEIIIDGIIVLTTSIIVVLLNNFFWRRRLRETYRVEIFKKRLKIYEQLLEKIGSMYISSGECSDKEINEFIKFLDKITYSNLLYISFEMHLQLENYMNSLMDFIKKEDYVFEESEGIIFKQAFKELGIGSLMREKELNRIFGKRRDFKRCWNEYAKQK